jgi:uncharacterized repeat protein (TIGR03803 family)
MKGQTQWTESVLHDFCNKCDTDDGAFPYSDLIADAQGNLYGTTAVGGTADSGTVFQVAPNGSETILHSFQGYPNDGMNPVAGLIADTQGNLYGTTQAAGSCGFNEFGCGTIFKVTPDGTESVLFNFCSNSKGESCQSGAIPTAALIMDNEGNLYGTAGGGGAGGSWDGCCGTVFKLAPDGKLTVLHAFAGQSHDDGNAPEAALIEIKGTLYGTTEQGGDYGGTAFAVRK